MQVSTAKGLPGNKEPATTSLRNDMPTCVFAMPKRTPFGKVNMHDNDAIIKNPLFIISAGNAPVDRTDPPPWKFHVRTIELSNSEGRAEAK